MADILAGIEIQRDQRVGVEVVAGPVRSVEIGRWIADDEVNPVGHKIDRGILPHAAPELGIGIANLGERVLFGLDIAMHIAAGCILGRPNPDGILRNGVEVPELLAGLGVIGAHEAADAVLAAIGTDQHLVLHHRRRHRLAIPEFGISDVGGPDHFAGLGIQGHKLGIEGCQVDPVIKNLNAAIVRTAAINRNRSHLVCVVPELLACLGIKCVDMAERGRDKHHTVNDDRRCFERLLDVGLEDPGDVQVLHVVAADLLARIEARLGVIAVGVQKILRAFVRTVEQFLRDRSNVRVPQRRFLLLLDLLSNGSAG